MILETPVANNRPMRCLVVTSLILVVMSLAVNVYFVWHVSKLHHEIKHMERDGGDRQAFKMLHDDVECLKKKMVSRSGFRQLYGGKVKSFCLYTPASLLEFRI